MKTRLDPGFDNYGRSDLNELDWHNFWCASARGVMSYEMFQAYAWIHWQRGEI